MITRMKVEKVIGKGYADKLDEPIFSVTNSFTYTRREMVELLGCANFIAAARLSKVLRVLKVTSPNKLYELDPISLARTKGIGESCIFVSMCILEASGHDVMKWWAYKDNTVKFSTFKHHALRKTRKHKQEVA